MFIILVTTQTEKKNQIFKSEIENPNMNNLNKRLKNTTLTNKQQKRASNEV